MRIPLKTIDDTGRAERLAAAEALEPAEAEGGPSAPSSSGVSGDDQIFDLQNLLEIADDTEGPGLALQFINDFLSLLQVRLSRLLTALADEEPTASVDAVLSMQTASSMAGATEIARHCGIILSFVAVRNFALALAQAAALQQSVEVLTGASPMLLEHAEAQLRARTALYVGHERYLERG